MQMSQNQPFRCAMHKRGLCRRAVSVRLAVRLSVCHVRVLYQKRVNNHILKLIFILESSYRYMRLSFPSKQASSFFNKNLTNADNDNSMNMSTNTKPYGNSLMWAMNASGV